MPDNPALRTLKIALRYFASTLHLFCSNICYLCDGTKTNESLITQSVTDRVNDQNNKISTYSHLKETFL